MPVKYIAVGPSAPPMMAIEAASGDGVLAIGAGNYGGKLGKFNFHLHEVMGES